MKYLKSFVFLFIAFLLFSSCTSEEQKITDLIQGHKGKVILKTKILYDIGKKAKTQPLSEASFAKDCKNVELVSRTNNWNTLVLHEEDFNNLTKQAKLDIRIYDDWQYTIPNVLQKTQKFKYKSYHTLKSIKKAFDRFLNLEYVFVIRNAQLEKPKLNNEKTKFTPGSYKAEALLFKVSQKKFLGGFLIAVENDANVYFKKGNLNSEIKALLGNLDTQATNTMYKLFSEKCSE